ncbi:hypothetical protein, partial, partial [Absidia glauca]
MLVILKTQLYHAARTFVNKLIRSDPNLSYEGVMRRLMDQYITPELIQTYEYAFNSMTQGIAEHPRTFYARLFEAAELAEIESESMIQSRFRAGLHNIIQQHCISLGCKDIDTWLKASEGYWMAHHPQKVSMAGNPFHPQSMNSACMNEMSTPTDVQITSGPSLNSIAATTTSTMPFDMIDLKKTLRDIIKEELNNHRGYQQQQSRPYQGNQQRSHNQR